ncbi:hypothetical protein LUW75_10810 [Streptomyces sp. MRC013]|uniref:hypothetical protein n=1 Tax=Streptomyces sp. MRC013 TaxID=2898276 RepID=UPI00202626B7|nr:hypothetical protein [Streptomyces sp. MRC013]URM90404.1 hypothetical protein LUW75_10810 [Streptomyces sp. MRC013]
MALRKTISLSELRDRRPSPQDEENGDTYQASRGWWHTPTDKPTTGTPKKG